MSENSGYPGQIEQIVEEFLQRQQAGEEPSVDEYCDRHPEFADELREVLEAVAMVRDLRPDSNDGPAHAQTPVPELPGEIGGYRIIRELGRGGMGVVYEAEHEGLGRRVALKLLSHSLANDQRALERFRQETRAAAKLHHTNIVPVFEAGTDGGFTFYAMQLIRGHGLDQVIDGMRRLREAPPDGADTSVEPAERVEDFHDDTPPTLESPAESALFRSGFGSRDYYDAVAQLGQQAAQALAYAHAHGVIHRDVKPSNLMLDANGEVWVADFGLAKTDAQGMTHTGDLVGTLRYMSPERFRGECDAAADVYGLGLTLYELLTLRPAFPSENPLELSQQVRECVPVRPRRLNRGIPRDLETVVLKAIARDPGKRYKTAEAMAEDLRRFREGEPVRARRSSAAERAVKWARRKPAVAAVYVTLPMLLLMVAGAAAMTWLWREAEGARTNLTAALENEAEAKDTLDQVLYLRRIALAAAQCGRDDWEGARRTLDECPADRRHWEWYYLNEVSRAVVSVTPPEGVDPHQVQAPYGFSIDGKYFDAGFGIVDSETGELVVLEPEPGSRTPDSDTARGDELAIFREFTGNLSARELATGVRLRIPTDQPQRVADQKTRRTELNHMGNSLSLESGYSTERRKRVAEEFVNKLKDRHAHVKNHLETPTRAWHKFSPNYRYVAFATSETELGIWDSVNEQVLYQLEDDSTIDQYWGSLPVFSLTFSPSGNLFAVRLSNSHFAKTGEILKVWSVATGRELCVIRSHDQSYKSREDHRYAYTFSADGRWLSLASGRKARVWDTTMGELVFESSEEYSPDLVWFSPNGKKLAAGQAGTKTVKIYDLFPKQASLILPYGKDRTTCATWSSQGNLVASGTEEGVLHIINRRHGGWEYWINRITWPFNYRLFRIAADVVWECCGINLWKLYCGDKLYDAGKPFSSRDETFNRVAAHERAITDVCFSRNERLLFSASLDGTIKIWEMRFGGEGEPFDSLSSREPVRTLDCEGISVASIDVSPDGQIVAAGMVDGTTRIATLSGNEAPRILQGHQGVVRDVRFHPNGRWIVTGGEDGSVRVWDVSSGESLRTLGEHRDCVNRLHFAPGGRLLLTTSLDGSVRAWDVEAGESLYSVPGHRGDAIHLAFNPDGTLFATAGDLDTRVRVWESATGKQVGRAIVTEEVPLLKHNRRLGVIDNPQVAELCFLGDRSLAIMTLDGFYAIGIDLDTPAREPAVGGFRLPRSSERDKRDLVVRQAAYYGTDGEFAIYCLDNHRIGQHDDSRTRPRPKGQFDILQILLGKALAEIPSGFSRPRIISGFHPDGCHVISDYVTNHFTPFILHRPAIASSPNHTTLQDTLIFKVWDICDPGRPSALMQLLVPSRPSSDNSPKKVIWKGQVFDYRSPPPDSPSDLFSVAYRWKGRRTDSVDCPDSQRIAVASGADIEIRSRKSDQLLHVLRGHTGEVSAMCFSSDGERLASASHDGTFRLWETKTGEEVLMINERTGEPNVPNTDPGYQVYDVEFSPDGSKILTTNSDGTVKIWEAPGFVAKEPR